MNYNLPNNVHNFTVREFKRFLKRQPNGWHGRSGNINHSLVAKFLNYRFGVDFCEIGHSLRTFFVREFALGDPRRPRNEVVHIMPQWLTDYMKYTDFRKFKNTKISKREALDSLRRFETMRMAA